MDDPLERITTLRREVEEAKAAVVKREAQAEQAQGVLDAALEEMKHLGCESPEQAEEEVERLKAELAGMVSEIETKLKEATG